MKNSKLRRVLLLLACAVLLVCLSVGATLAYLTSTTDVVENTFSVGNTEFHDPEGAIAGGLDETKVDVFGERDDNATTRVTENEYKIMPNHEYTKDPVVHIGDESEPVWVFVRVQNPITAIEADVTDFDSEILNEDGTEGWTMDINGTIHEQMVNMEGWVQIAGDAVDGVYAFPWVVQPGTDVEVFHAFAIQGDLEYDDIKDYADMSIDVQAYIVQADGFEGATGYLAAYEAAPCEYKDAETGAIVKWPTIAAAEETPDAAE